MLENNQGATMTDNTQHKLGWTTSELARELNVDPSRIRQLLLDGTIKGVKFGKMWSIPDSEARRIIEQYKGEF